MWHWWRRGLATPTLAPPQGIPIRITINLAPSVFAGRPLAGHQPSLWPRHGPRQGKGDLAPPALARLLLPPCRPLRNPERLVRPPHPLHHPDTCLPTQSLPLTCNAFSCRLHRFLQNRAERHPVRHPGIPGPHPRRAGGGDPRSRLLLRRGLPLHPVELSPNKCHDVRHPRPFRGSA